MANELIETLALTIDGMADDTFRPYRVSGVDEVSQLFRFEIDVVSDDPSLDETLIFGHTATEPSRVSRRLLFVRRSYNERNKEQVFA